MKPLILKFESCTDRQLDLNLLVSGSIPRLPALVHEQANLSLPVRILNLLSSFVKRNCDAASVGEIKTKIWFYQTS